jgi:hypothetical protein
LVARLKPNDANVAPPVIRLWSVGAAQPTVVSRLDGASLAGTQLDRKLLPSRSAIVAP